MEARLVVLKTRGHSAMTKRGLSVLTEDLLSPRESEPWCCWHPEMVAWRCELLCLKGGSPALYSALPEFSLSVFTIIYDGNRSITPI